MGDGIRVDGDGEDCEDSMGVELGLFTVRVGVVEGENEGAGTEPSSLKSKYKNPANNTAKTIVALKASRRPFNHVTF